MTTLKSSLSETDRYSYAITKDRLSEIDPNELDTHEIPIDHVWPPYHERLTRALDPLPVGSYAKQPSLLDYGDTPASLTSLGNRRLRRSTAYNFRGQGIVTGHASGTSLAKATFCILF